MSELQLNEDIKELQDQLKDVIMAYQILEEYTCLLLGSDATENETLTHCNSIVQMSLNRL